MLVNRYEEWPIVLFNYFKQLWPSYDDRRRPFFGPAHVVDHLGHAEMLSLSSLSAT